MTFYKLYDYKTNQDVNLNPNAIEYYIYKDTYVEIHLFSQQYMCTDKVDFENMLILEGVNEY